MEQNKLLQKINLAAWLGLAVFAISLGAASLSGSNLEILWFWLPIVGLAVGCIFGLWAVIKKSDSGFLALILSLVLSLWFLLASTGL